MKKTITFLVVAFLIVMNADGQTAYVISTNGSTSSNIVYIIDVPTKIITDSILLPYYASPYGISVSPDGSMVYITNSMDNYWMDIIYTATDSISGIGFDQDYNPCGVVFSPDGSKAYVTVFYQPNLYYLYVINTATNGIIAEIPVGNGANGVCVSPDGTKVYVTNISDNTISVIDAIADTVTATISVGHGPYDAAVSPDGTKVYVTNEQDTTVSVINTATNAVTNIISSEISNPITVCFSLDGSKAYIANYGHDNVVVINTATNTVINTIAANPSPWGLSITPDGTELFVTCRDGYVDVINIATNTITDTITVEYYLSVIGNFISSYSPTTGIPSQNNTSTNVSIYPNPFSTTATLVINWGRDAINRVSTNTYLQIYNLLGQEVKTIPIINQKEITINRDNLPDGMYFYKIIGNKNETVATGKMVIQ